jgi:hypothetical protein
MSDLRLNYSEKSFKTILTILEDLSKIQDDEQFAIKGWGKTILDYGIKQSELDKVDSDKQRLFQTTERQFKSYKYALLDLRFIREYNKDNRVKGGPFWSITPLGYMYLEKFQKNHYIIKLFEFLNRSASNSLKKYEKKQKTSIEFTDKKSWQTFNDDKKLVKSFDQDQINKAITVLFDNIDFDYQDNRLTLTLYAFNPTSLNKITLTQVLITNSYINITKPNRTSKVNLTTQSDLEFGLSYYLSLLVSYYLITYSKKSELEEIPIRFSSLVNNLRQMIQENSILDFVEINKKSIQSSGMFDTKLIKLITKDRLIRAIETL